MAKVMMSARLEANVLGWAKVYAKQRDVSLATVLEAALREFREACEGGVPELGPVEATAARAARARAVRQDAAPAASRATSRHQELMWERQERLNRGRS
jgi:hypothetical protein